MTSLCVIPARGGSRRLPGKNIRKLAGVPVLARTIAVVLESGVADRVVVSTDDDRIADVARAAGAEVPFRRDPDLADEHTATIPVVADAIRQLGGTFDTTWIVYPTAALLEPADLVQARETFVSSGATVAMSVIESPGPIERAWRRDHDGRGAMTAPEHVESRTQDLPAAYFDAGQFYVADATVWLDEPTLAQHRPLLIPLPRQRAVDVDTIDDWRYLEMVFAARSTRIETDRLEALWSGEFGDRYVERNREAGDPRGPFWDRIVTTTQPRSVLEVGCNTGNNLRWLADGSRRVVGVDINQGALEELARRVPSVETGIASARSLPYGDDQFDLVFTAGVLIHQPDESLEDVMAEMRRCSNRWILLAEYFAPTREEVHYRGVDGALFRRDYGGLFAAMHRDVTLRDSGFLGREDGWDDVTWWLFEATG